MIITKRINVLSGEIKLISAKGLAKYLINGCSILNATKYFVQEDGVQNDLIFQPVFMKFKTSTNNDMVMVRKSKALSNESIKPLANFCP